MKIYNIVYFNEKGKPHLTGENFNQSTAIGMFDSLQSAIDYAPLVIKRPATHMKDGVFVFDDHAEIKSGPIGFMLLSAVEVANLWYEECGEALNQKDFGALL